MFYLRNFFSPSLCTLVVLPNYYFCVSFSPCMVGVLLSKLCISFSLYGRFITYKVFTLSLCKRVCYFRIVCVSLSICKLGVLLPNFYECMSCWSLALFLYKLGVFLTKQRVFLSLLNLRTVYLLDFFLLKYIVGVLITKKIFLLPKF